jgi:3'-phosphoadenosine 5'-phosphosulfate sulfotransferase (PAPS reductase)/FAD synthetase
MYQRIEEGRDADGVLHVLGLSGGKDSTALALRMKELNPDLSITHFCTPTGDELPEMIAHWERLESLLGQKIVQVRAKYSLNELIEKMGALPNWRQRWCTRVLKIEPALAWYAVNAPVVAYVGLRADEETREGVYGSEVPQRYPMREWGWTIDDVWNYLDEKGICIPKRTDCARCYGQRLGEWQDLYNHYPHLYAEAEAQEEKIGATFRSPGRDTRPAALKDLKQYFPLKTVREVNPRACRVCSL